MKKFLVINEAEFARIKNEKGNAELFFLFLIIVYYCIYIPGNFRSAFLKFSIFLPTNLFVYAVYEDLFSKGADFVNIFYSIACIPLIYGTINSVYAMYKLQGFIGASIRIIFYFIGVYVLFYLIANSIFKDYGVATILISYPILITIAYNLIPKKNDKKNEKI